MRKSPKAAEEFKKKMAAMSDTNFIAESTKRIRNNGIKAEKAVYHITNSLYKNGNNSSHFRLNNSNGALHRANKTGALQRFLGSPLFNWLSSLGAFSLFLIEESFYIDRNKLAIFLPKLVLYQALLFEIFQLKTRKHRLSASPVLTNIFLRNFMVHAIFGIFNYRKLALPVHSLWFLTDSFKYLHFICNSKITAFLRYCITIPLFVLQAFFECLAIINASSNLPIPVRAFFVFIFFFHLVSLETVLKHKILQYMWYKRRYH